MLKHMHLHSLFDYHHSLEWVVCKDFFPRIIQTTVQLAFCFLFIIFIVATMDGTEMPIHSEAGHWGKLLHSTLFTSCLLG